LRFWLVVHHRVVLVVAGPAGPVALVPAEYFRFRS
jgi:hypothetical protein